MECISDFLLTGYRAPFWFPTRLALFDSGVHRHLRAGIATVSGQPAESVLLSGGYEDDDDRGDVVIYTGQDGGDARTGRQVCDQGMNRYNRALVRGVETAVPVRLMRWAASGSQHAPSTDYEYSGLYRVRECWYEDGKAGFGLYRFRLVRLHETATTGAVCTMAKTVI